VNRYVFHLLVPAFVANPSIFYIIFAAVGSVKELHIMIPQESTENILTVFLKYWPAFWSASNIGRTARPLTIRELSLFRNPYGR
jgi:hypothetical protein